MNKRNMLKTYLKDIKNLPRISKQKEKDLSFIIMNSKDKKAVEKAIKDMVEGNIKLAIKYAFKYYRKYPTSLSEMDLIEEANMGLIKAAEKYDASTGTRFSTYAVASICSHMDRAIQNDRTIRIPPNHFKYLKQIKELQDKHGEDVSDDVLVNELDISIRLLKILKNNMRNKTIELDDNEMLSQTLSVDEKEPYARIKLQELGEELESVIDELSPMEKEIVISKHFSDRDLTYAEIASKHGVSRQRIEQIYTASLKKLKLKMKNRKRKGK